MLIRNGMLKKKALFWNFISSLFAFIGLYVGINVASCEGYHDWVFAVTTGIFIHIALVDLVSYDVMSTDDVHKISIVCLSRIIP